MILFVSVFLYMFMGCGTSNDDSSLFTQIPDLINILCPGSDACSYNRSQKGADDFPFRPGTESCCTECSCSPKCSKTGNCCFQNTLSSQNVFEDKLHGTRKDRSCLYPVFPQQTTDHTLYQSFLMVSSVQKTVPIGKLDSSNISCGERKVAPWGSLYPVYSARSKQIYKNIECAREDGEETEVTIWNAVIGCQDVHDGVTAFTLYTNSIPDSCNVYFVFPGNFNDLRTSKCYINLIDTCSEFQDFEVPKGTNLSKDDIRDLCSNSGLVSPYRAEEMYANVFYHICNAESFFRETYCYKVAEGFPSRSTPFGIMALIDIKFLSHDSDTGNALEQVIPVACSNIDGTVRMCKKKFDFGLQFIENGPKSGRPKHMTAKENVAKVEETNEKDARYTERDRARMVERCRPLLCPLGQIRVKTNKCVYPSKMWYHQTYVIYINITLENLINVSKVFNIPQGRSYTTDLPNLGSAWLEDWQIDYIYYRLMDAPLLSFTNNIIIVVHRQLSSVKPGLIIKNIKRMIGQAWSIGFHNETELLKSPEFSRRSTFWKDEYENKANDFANLTEQVETSTYRSVFFGSPSYQTEHVVTKLYFC